MVFLTHTTVVADPDALCVGPAMGDEVEALV